VLSDHAGDENSGRNLKQQDKGKGGNSQGGKSEIHREERLGKERTPLKEPSGRGCFRTVMVLRSGTKEFPSKSFDAAKIGELLGSLCSNSPKKLKCEDSEPFKLGVRRVN